MEMSSQSIENLRGEVEFRKKLSKQHVTGEILLPNYYSKKVHDKILLERINTTSKKILQLIEKGVSISPFIELGAERCQRSLVLTNDFNASGFSVDISYHQLKTAEHFAQLFNRPRLPYRVCCDVNNLPFKNNSFSFVFCYEFLHHFPSPTPILEEVYRILSNGTFFFDEEPFKRPKIAVYRQRKTDFYLKRNKIIRFLEGFIAEGYCAEREHGIIENDDISLQQYICALSVFTKKTVYISSIDRRITTELCGRVRMKNILNMLLGGNIEGICIKNTSTKKIEISNMTDFLLCPNCQIQPKHEMNNQQSLMQKQGGLVCKLCGSSYPVIDGVLFLLPRQLFHELYPEYVTYNATNLS